MEASTDHAHMETVYSFLHAQGHAHMKTGLNSLLVFTITSNLEQPDTVTITYPIFMLNVYGPDYEVFIICILI